MKKINPNSLGEYVRTLRESRGYSLNRASKFLSVSGAQIKLWESSPERIPLSKLEKMVDAYHGDPEKLVDLVLGVSEKI